MPTLVMWGMADTALLPSNLPGLSDSVDGLEMIEADGATHWINHEEAELIAGNIETFVQ